MALGELVLETMGAQTKKKLHSTLRLPSELFIFSFIYVVSSFFKFSFKHFFSFTKNLLTFSFKFVFLNFYDSSIYNISITGISVENSSVNVGFSALVDSGTSFTYLADPAYTSLSSSVSNLNNGLHILEYARV